MVLIMVSKSSKAFNSWRKRTGLTYKEASIVLGICMASIGYYTRGERKNVDISEPVEVPKTVLLACSAVEANLPPIQ